MVDLRYVLVPVMTVVAGLISVSVLVRVQDGGAAGAAYRAQFRSHVTALVRPSSASVTTARHAGLTPPSQSGALPNVRVASLPFVESPSAPRAAASPPISTPLPTPESTPLPTPVATPLPKPIPTPLPSTFASPIATASPTLAPTATPVRAVYEFDATAPHLARGERTFLCVGVDGFASATVSGIGRVPVGVTSCHRIAPRFTTTYVLDAEIAGSAVRRALTVTVRQPRPQPSPFVSAIVSPPVVSLPTARAKPKYTVPN